MDNQLQVWAQVLSHLEKLLSKPSFETWIKGTSLKELNNDNKTAVIEAPNDFARDWLESRYTKLLKEALYYLTDQFYEITFVERKEADVHDENELLEFLDILTLPLNPDKTFDNFTLSSSNRLAKIAAKSVADAPGKAYNPLVIWGPTSSGKTHLLYAIGNHILANNEQSEVIYMTANYFKNEVKKAKRVSQFNKLKCSVIRANVFLLDDIDLLENDEITQFELFNIFNELFTEGIQVVFASSKEPKQLNFMEKLKERLTWGLITNMEVQKEELSGITSEPTVLDNSPKLATSTARNLPSEATLKKINSMMKSERNTNIDCLDDALLIKIDQLIETQHQTNELLSMILKKVEGCQRGV